MPLAGRSKSDPQAVVPGRIFEGTFRSFEGQVSQTWGQWFSPVAPGRRQGQVLPLDSNFGDVGRNQYLFILHVNHRFRCWHRQFDGRGGGEKKGIKQRMCSEDMPIDFAGFGGG